MAFLWKHPQSKYFMARFIDASGKRRNRSTRSTLRKEAQKIADTFEKAAQKNNTIKQLRKVVSELHKEISGEEIPAQTVKDFSDAWLAKKNPEVSPSTHAFYKTLVGKFLTFLEQKAAAPMTDLTAEDIVKFRNHLVKSLSARTVNHNLKGLKMLFKAAKQDRVISEDPSEFVTSTKKAPKKPRRPFTVDELKKLIAVADEEWKSMIRFGLYTGQRLGDIAKIKWGDIDLERGRIRLVTQKTSKSLVLPIAQPLKTHLQSLKKNQTPEAPIHQTSFGIIDKQGRTANLSNRFSDLLAKAGLQEKKSHSKKGTSAGRHGARASAGLGFHCLRHTAVTMLQEAGIPLAVVMEIAGHDSEQMSHHYTHVGDEALQKAASSLPVI